MIEGQVTHCCAADGDLCDRLTILEIKLCRINDTSKLKAVRKEHELLANLFHNSFVVSHALLTQLSLLQAVNEQLWEIEDELRAHERIKGVCFMRLS